MAVKVSYSLPILFVEKGVFFTLCTNKRGPLAVVHSKSFWMNERIRTRTRFETELVLKQRRNATIHGNNLKTARKMLTSGRSRHRKCYSGSDVFVCLLPWASSEKNHGNWRCWQRSEWISECVCRGIRCSQRRFDSHQKSRREVHK